MKDGGAIWEEQTNPADQPLREVCFATDQRGLAVGLVGTILYTTDGGANWEARPNSGYRWQSVFLTQSGKAWAVGDKGRIAYSTDWGYTWEAQESGVSVELWQVYFINDDEGWIVGGGIGQPGVILHTKNGGVVSGVEAESIKIPGSYILEQNYPNPFNSITKIKFQTPNSQFVSLKVYDIQGKNISTIVSQYLTAGNHDYSFNAANLASGIFYYELITAQYREVKKMILLR
jgi:hypothetical protein